MKNKQIDERIDDILVTGEKEKKQNAGMERPNWLKKHKIKNLLKEVCMECIGKDNDSIEAKVAGTPMSYENELRKQQRKKLKELLT